VVLVVVVEYVDDVVLLDVLDDVVDELDVVVEDVDVLDDVVE
jgi:hypothetical protein